MMAGQGLKRSLATQRLTETGAHEDTHTKHANRKHGKW